MRNVNTYYWPASLTYQKTVKACLNLDEFNRLSLAERICAIFAYGTFLAFRQEESYTVVLYHMGNFFGEVYYDRSLEGVILAQGLQGTSCFDSFLPQIKLSELILNE